MTKVERFEKFVAARFRVGDWSNYLSADQSRLSRQKILGACQFARSSLYQNPVIKSRLSEIEEDLRCAGVLRKVNSMPDTLLDETSGLIVMAEIEERLETLTGRMRRLLSSIEAVRNEVKKFNAG